MEILVFRTSLKYKKDIKVISSYLNAQDTIIKWNVDFEDWEKILRVEARISLSVNQLISEIKKLGFECSELED